MTESLGPWVGAGLAALVVLVVLIGSAAGGALGSAMGGSQPGARPADVVGAVPPEYLSLYQEAAATCPGLPWSVLAAVGTIESDNGASRLPGVQSGSNAAGAEGPMQLEPGTFAEYADPVPPGGAEPPSPYDPTDAVYAAARDLCANGARDGADLPGALFAYNHADWYVAAVLAIAQQYAASALAEKGPSLPTHHVRLRPMKQFRAIVTNCLDLAHVVPCLR